MILVTGSFGFDHIMDFPGTFEENILPDKIKTLSVSFLVHTFSKNFGGTAGNIAYTLGLLGQKASVLASAGKDFAAYKKHLEKVGVSTNRINIVKNDFTGNFFVITDKNDCQIAGFYPGAMRQDAKLTIGGSARLGFVVVAPTMPEAMTNFARECKALGIPYLYNPAQQIPRLTKEQLQEGLRGAEVVVGSDYEMEFISRKAGVTKEELVKMAKVLITTLGAKGSVIERGGQVFKVGIAKPERVVDPTGAGDAYLAGFLTGYIKGLELTVSGQIAATAAVYAIENYGTQNHKFTKKEFMSRYRQNFGKSIEL